MNLLYLIEDKLLIREEFKKQIFGKTNGKCCVPGCDCNAVDANHIMDRKLWADWGYYISNDAALYSKHHLDVERGLITPIECLEYMGINLNDIRTPDKLIEKI